VRISNPFAVNGFNTLQLYETGLMNTNSTLLTTSRFLMCDLTLRDQSPRSQPFLDINNSKLQTNVLKLT
jgi:hypothetical protein